MADWTSWSGPPLQDFTRLKSNSKYQAVVHPFPGTFYLIQLNVTMPPFDNKRCGRR